MKTVLKICGDPSCSAVWHNCPKKHTHCGDCGGNLIEINWMTYLKSYSWIYFQYDTESGEYLYPETTKQIEMQFIDSSILLAD